MSFPKDIPDLIEANVISPETAKKIKEYYKNKGGDSSNRLFIIFGVLGALLIGLGIILIIAHNWDELSRSTKTIFAFLPLVVGQILCAFTLIKKSNNQAWRESSTVFLFFAVGASISLVSQIYNLPDDVGTFLFTWMILCLPLIYIMKSSMASLLYLAGITYYTVESCYSYPETESYWYWFLLFLALPHYYMLYKQHAKSNYLTFHNWLFPLSVVICLGTISDKMDEIMFIAYFSLFGLFYIIGHHKILEEQKTINNSYKIIGSLGTIILLLVLSFDWFWEDLKGNQYDFIKVLISPEFIMASSLSIMATYFLLGFEKIKTMGINKPLSFVYILFIITFIAGLFSSISIVLINLIVFGIGLLTIRDGANKDHLGILNFGLLVITALVLCRFFDSNISFVLRGILFVTVGIGFFLTNYWILKKRKAHDK